MLPYLTKHVVEDLKRPFLFKLEAARTFGCVDNPVVAALALDQGVSIVAIKPCPVLRRF